MPLLTYRDIAVDAHNPRRVAEFWAGFLQFPMTVTPGGAVRIDFGHGNAAWIRPGGNGHLEGFRISFDITPDAMQRALDAGVQIVDDETHPWSVIRGPEGVELHLHPEEGASALLPEIVLASPEPSAAARWWARVLATGHETSVSNDFAWVRPVPESPFHALRFASSPYLPPRPGHQQVRLGFVTTDLDRLLRMGATIVGADTASDEELVCADPQGNEFRLQVRDVERPLRYGPR